MLSVFYLFYYRLQQIIAQKELVHETLVTPDKLAAATTELYALRSENLRIATTHRQLLIRYAAVKFMIDGSFKKIEQQQEQLGQGK